METKAPSPGEKYLFHIFPWEARMSLWVETPQLMDTVSGQSLLAFENANWSLDEAQWLDEERVRLYLRCYPGDHSPSSFEVMIDCQQKQARLRDGEPVPLRDLEKVLEETLCRQVKPPPTTPSQPAWRRQIAVFLKRWFGLGQL
jgi:hypothetical protein